MKSNMSDKAIHLLFYSMLNLIQFHSSHNCVVYFFLCFKIKQNVYVCEVNVSVKCKLIQFCTCVCLDVNV